MRVPQLVLRVLDPAEHYTRKQKSANEVQNRLGRPSNVATGGTSQGSSPKPQEETADRLAPAALGGHWTTYAGTAARDLIATGKAVVPCEKGSLNCEFIHFWVGDAVLTTQFLTPEGKLRTSSITRIRRNADQQSAIEKRLVRLFEAIG